MKRFIAMIICSVISWVFYFYVDRITTIDREIHFISFMVAVYFGFSFLLKQISYLLTNARFTYDSQTSIFRYSLLLFAGSWFSFAIMYSDFIHIYYILCFPSIITALVPYAKKSKNRSKRFAASLTQEKQQIQEKKPNKPNKPNRGFWDRGNEPSAGGLDMDHDDYFSVGEGGNSSFD